MTTPPPVLLVLAWDDNDPSVHRVAPAGALPTLPLVRALAARQPVLALLPQLHRPHPRTRLTARVRLPYSWAWAPARGWWGWGISLLPG